MFYRRHRAGFSEKPGACIIILWRARGICGQAYHAPGVQCRDRLSGQRSRYLLEVQDMATAVLDDEEAVQQPERRRRDREQIHRGEP